MWRKTGKIIVWACGELWRGKNGQTKFDGVVISILEITTLNGASVLKNTTQRRFSQKKSLKKGHLKSKQSPKKPLRLILRLLG